MRDFELVDGNLRTALRFFGEATGKGEVRSMEGTDAIYSGLDYGVVNIAALSRPVGSGAGALEARIAEGTRVYQPGTMSWSVWGCDDVVDAGLRRGSR